MSVDALVDSDQMSREMIERVGPRVALQPCDDPKYRELAQEFLDFAAECEEPITTIRLTGENTVEVDYSHDGYIEPGTQLAVYNSILALHLAGEGEVPLEEFVNTVDLGGLTLDQANKTQVVYGTITMLEGLVPHATFYADAVSGSLHLERDVVVIDSRFTDTPSETPIEVEILTNTPESETVKEQVVAIGGIAQQRFKHQPKFDLVVEGVNTTLSRDELAVLQYAISLRTHTDFRSVDVLNSEHWVVNGRELEAMRTAFSRAAAKLCAKYPDCFSKEGKYGDRSYHLTRIPEVYLPAFTTIEEPVAIIGIQKAIRKRRNEVEVKIDQEKVFLSQDELAILSYAAGLSPGTRFKRADVLDSRQWRANRQQDGASGAHFRVLTARLCEKLPDIFMKEGKERGRNYYLTRIPKIDLYADGPLDVAPVDTSSLETLQNDFDEGEEADTSHHLFDVDFEVDSEVQLDESSRGHSRHRLVGREALVSLPQKKLPRYDGPTIVEIEDDTVDIEALLEGYDPEGIVGRVSAFIFLNQDMSEQDFAYLSSRRPDEVIDYLKGLELPDKFFMAGNFMAQRFWLLCVDLRINEVYKEKRFKSKLGEYDAGEDQLESMYEQVAVNDRKTSAQPTAFITTNSITISATPVEPDPDWHDYANCLGVDPDLFFPERGASTREAKEVCRSCEVRHDCLEFSLQSGEKFGIWGGLSERERRRIRRQRAQAARSNIGA
jgi:WhiB family redox-sensing transcriptional regulator